MLLKNWGVSGEVYLLITSNQILGTCTKVRDIERPSQEWRCACGRPSTTWIHQVAITWVSQRPRPCSWRRTDGSGGRSQRQECYTSWWWRWSTYWEINFHFCAIPCARRSVCHLSPSVLVLSQSLNIIIVFLPHPLYNVICPCPSGSASLLHSISK